MEKINENMLESILNDYMFNKDKLTVKGIIEKYKLDIPTSKLKSILPLLDSESKCPYCNTLMKREITGRGEYSEPFCEICGHREHNTRKDYCRCTNCDKRRKEIIKIKYGGEKNKTKFSELPVLTQIIIGRILEKNKFKSFDTIKGSNIWEDNHFNTLHKMNLISVSPNSPIDAFDLGDKFLSLYYPYYVIYDWMVFFSEEEKARLVKGDYFFNLLNDTEKMTILKQYIHEDIMNRFKELMKERGLQLEVLPTAETLFTELYKELSYSEIITLCYHVARYCLDQTKTNKMYRKVAEKGAIKMAITFWENDKKKGWPLKKSEVGYCGAELQWFIKNVLKSDLSILNNTIV